MALQRWIVLPTLGTLLSCVSLSIVAVPQGAAQNPAQGQPQATSQTPAPVAQQPVTPKPNPNLDITVTPQAGQWMVCVASYTGPDAADLARQLVMQLRNRDRLPAYVFNQADENRKKQKEELEERQKQAAAINPLIPVRKRSIRIEEQFAVLVGGYPDMETARKTMETIKSKVEKPQLKLASGRPAYDLVHKPTDDGKGTKTEEVNPLKSAFVVRNPSIPQHSTAQRIDPLWWKLNSKESYSLLECKKKWTYVVKSYVGARAATSMLSPTKDKEEDGFFNKLWSDPDKKGLQLEKTAEQAHELARVLRQLNFEAYVLHTRTGSIVTVGSFEKPDDQEATRVSKQLKTMQEQMKKQPSGDVFQLYQFPAVMEVPRQPKEG